MCITPEIPIVDKYSPNLKDIIEKCNFYLESAILNKNWW